MLQKQNSGNHVPWPEHPGGWREEAKTAERVTLCSPSCALPGGQTELGPKDTEMEEP